MREPLTLETEGTESQRKTEKTAVNKKEKTQAVVEWDFGEWAIIVCEKFKEKRKRETVLKKTK